MEPKAWAPLSDDFKPPKLLFRDEQLREMLELCLHPLSCNIWVQGDKGLGKTLTARIFMDEIEAKGVGKCYYLEWERQLNNTFKKFRDKYTLKIPDYMLAPSSIAQEIISETDKNDLICIILDEPQKAHKWEYVDSVAYELYQSFTGQRKLSLVFLSQIRYPVAEQKFSPDTRSRLRLKGILFPNYTADQIIEILKQRLNYMLDENQYDTRALAVLASHIRRIGSDIREALDILRKAIETAEDYLSAQVMKQAITWGKKRWWQTDLESLPPHWAYLLFLTAKLHQQKQEVTQNEVMYEYLKTSNHLKFDPLAKRSIYHAFNKLNEKGYFDQQIEGYGRRRKTKLVMDTSTANHIAEVGRNMDWTFLLQTAN